MHIRLFPHTEAGFVSGQTLHTVPTLCYSMDTVSHAVTEYFSIHANTFPVLSPEAAGCADSLCKGRIQYPNTLSKHQELRVTTF